MNKPLTIEELKSLKVGDWVWIENRYYQKQEFEEENGRYFRGHSYNHQVILAYEDYNMTWLAYKNKETAEGKDEEIRKQTAKEILDEVSKHYGGAWLIELYKKYGVEV